MELYRTFTEGMMIGATVEEVRTFLAEVGYDDPFEDWEGGSYGEIATGSVYAPLRFVFDFDEGVVQDSYFDECEE